MSTNRFPKFMAVCTLCVLTISLNPNPVFADDAPKGPVEPVAKCGDCKINQASEQCDDGESGSTTCTKECTKIAPTAIKAIDVESGHFKTLEVDDGHVKVLKVDEIQLKKPLTVTADFGTLKMPELTSRRQSYGFAFMARDMFGTESPTPNALQLDAAILWRDIPTHVGFRFAASPGIFWFPGDGMNGESKSGFAMSLAGGFLAGWERGGLYFGPQATYLGAGYRDQIMVDLSVHGYVLFNGDKDTHSGILDIGVGYSPLRPHNMVGQDDSFHAVMFTVGLGYFIRPQPIGPEDPTPAKAEPPAPKCGDGEVNQASEECDHGPSGSPKCTKECKKIP